MERAVRCQEIVKNKESRHKKIKRLADAISETHLMGHLVEIAWTRGKDETRQLGRAHYRMDTTGPL